MAKPNMPDTLTIAGREFRSRLFLGSAGYPNRQLMLDAIAASGTEMVTASIRRISLAGDDESLTDLLAGRVHFLPNTAGCQTAKDAILTAELAREALQTNWIKVEVIGDRELLYPDVEELVRATEALVAKGFVVLPYRHLQSAPDRADLRSLVGAGGARCRHRHRLRRGARHGARLLGGAAQYRRLQGQRSGRDGARDGRRRRGGTARPSRRPHS